MNQQIEASLLLKAIDHTGVGVVLTNPRLHDNPIIYVNKGFQELTGYFSNEVMGHNCRFLQGEKTKQEDVQKIRDTILPTTLARHSDERAMGRRTLE